MFMKTALLQRECKLCLRLQAKLPPLTYIHIGKACTPAISTASVTAIKLRHTRVPKLPLGNPVSKAPALRAGKLELPVLNSQAGAWELARRRGSFFLNLMALTQPVGTRISHFWRARHVLR